MRTAAGRAELARRDKRGEERGRRVVEERCRLGLSEQVYDRLPEKAKQRILELEARMGRV
jgi:hypothetical protein